MAWLFSKSRVAKKCESRSADGTLVHALVTETQDGWNSLVRTISSSGEGETPKHGSPARAASSLFVEGSEENRGRPVAFGRREQVERLGVKVDDTVVLCG